MSRIVAEGPTGKSSGVIEGGNVCLSENFFGIVFVLEREKCMLGNYFVNVSKLVLHEIFGIVERK